MGYVTGTVLFVVYWWVIFAAALPFGVRRPNHVEKGHASGAPENPNLRRKALWTTVLATLALALTQIGLSQKWIVLDQPKDAPLLRLF